MLIVVIGLLINNAYSVTAIPSLNFAIDTTSLDSNLTDTLSVKKIPISNNAPEFQVKYFATDSIQFDNENQIVYLFGEAKVEYGAMKIQADVISVNIRKNEVHALGKKDSTGKVIEKVHFVDKDESFDAPEMKYNFKTKKGKIIEVTTQEGDSYLLANEAKIMPGKEIFIAKGKITTCDHDDPHFYFEAQKLKVVPGKKIVVGPTNLVIRDLPTPIWVPFGVFPNNTKRQSGILIPGQGKDNNQFGLKELGFHWAINDYIHAEFLTDLYFSGTFRLNTELKYKKKYRYDGSFKFNYNSLVRGEKDLSNYTKSTDFNFFWRYNQDVKAHPKRRLSIYIDAKSPSYNQTLNLTSNSAINSVQSRSLSSINWGWNEKNWSININSQLQQNFGLETVDLNAPSITWRRNTWKPFDDAKNELISNIGITTSANFSNRVTRGDSTFFDFQTLNYLRNGVKANVNINVGRSFKVLKYLNFTFPAINANVYGITEEITKRSFNDSTKLSTDTVKTFRPAYDYSLTNVGFNTNIFGTYRLKDGMKIGGFRHKITPSATLSYTPDHFITDQNIKQLVYDSLYNRWTEYSRFETAVYAPNASKQFRANFSIDNNLQAKVRKNSDSTGVKYEKVNLINSFRINSSYNFLADSLKWSDLSASINTNPGFLKRLNFTAVLSPYAIDDNGFKYDSLLWSSGNIGRLTRFVVNADIEFRRAQFVKLLWGIPMPKDGFDWTFNLSYTFSYSKPTITGTTNKTIGINGMVKLTDNWSVNYNLPVNIEQKDLSTSSFFGIKRNLHCWEFSLEWFPFFTNTNYTFTIRPRAGLLQDLKYEKRRFN